MQTKDVLYVDINKDDAVICNYGRFANEAVQMTLKQIEQAIWFVSRTNLKLWPPPMLSLLTCTGECWCWKTAVVIQYFLSPIMNPFLGYVYYWHTSTHSFLVLKSRLFLINWHEIPEKNVNVVVSPYCNLTCFLSGDLDVQVHKIHLIRFHPFRKSDQFIIDVTSLQYPSKYGIKKNRPSFCIHTKWTVNSTCEQWTVLAGVWLCGWFETHLITILPSELAFLTGQSVACDSPCRFN